MAGYSSIEDLDEKYNNDLIGTEVLLLVGENESNKVSLTSLSAKITELGGADYNEFRNRIISDISNIVHANALHFEGVPYAVNINKGDWVKLRPDVENDVVYVEKALANEDIIGVCTLNTLTGTPAAIMTHGILKGIDTTTFAEGDLLYFQDGVLTNSPDFKTKNQLVATVLDSALDGRILIDLNNNHASTMMYDNSDGNIASNTIQTALDELGARQIKKTTRITITGDEITLPELALGGLVNNIASIFETTGAPNVITEYSCTLSPDKSRVLFDVGDNLNGFECEVPYIAVV